MSRPTGQHSMPTWSCQVDSSFMTWEQRWNSICSLGVLWGLQLLTVEFAADKTEDTVHKSCTHTSHTLQGTNISHLWRRKIIFKSAVGWDMLISNRVHTHASALFAEECYHDVFGLLNQTWRWDWKAFVTKKTPGLPMGCDFWWLSESLKALKGWNAFTMSLSQ